MTAPRILIVSHTYAAPINRAKLDALARLVQLAAVIPARWRDALFAQPYRSGDDAVHALYALPIRLGGRIMVYHYRWADLRRALGSFRPELVYVEQEPASLALAQFAWLKRRYGFKLVFFTWENVEREAHWLARFTLSHCDGAIAGNREAAEVLRRQGYAGPIRVTPQLGLDPAAYAPGCADDLRRELGLEGFVVGYVGRLVAEKGLLPLAQAVAELPQAMLLLVGDGPLRPDLERLGREGALAGRLRLAGSVPHERVPGYLRACDALVLPSLTMPRWKEQFGHVLIEAMACGVPVIGSDSGAISEVIGGAGLIAPEGDATALRDAIKLLMQDPSTRARLAAEGRARALAHYTHEAIAAANAEFFAEILAQ